jgi:hypothetical protein
MGNALPGHPLGRFLSSGAGRFLREIPLIASPNRRPPNRSPSHAGNGRSRGPGFGRPRFAEILFALPGGGALC